MLDMELLESKIKKVAKDKISKKELEKLIKDIKKLKYTPSFLSSFKIKNERKIREVIIEDEKDKLIEKALLEVIYPIFEPYLNENNFAFVKNKTIFEAIEKVNFLTNSLKDVYYLKVDIKDFFNNIDHQILSKMLLNKIDENLLYLIMLFFKNRKVYNNEYLITQKGVHQGGVLSPFLSNIYLTPFDNFLEKRAKFVRFADDIIIFTKTPDKLLYQIKRFLKFFNLSLNEEKTSISNKSFVFLNIRFRENIYYLDNEKFNTLISRLSKINFSNSQEVNNFLNSINSYYSKFLNEKQFEILRKNFLNFLSKNYIKSKFDYSDINSTILDISQSEIKKYIKKYKIHQIEKKVDKVLNKQLIDFSKLQGENVIFVTKKGRSVGVSKNKIVVKFLKKIEFSMPINKVEKILILNSHISISSNLVLKANEKGIDIEFIKDSKPYATINTFNSKIFDMTLKQIEIINSPKRLIIAKEFIKGKLKNQLNYIKYLSKYHKQLKQKIPLLEKVLSSLKDVKNIDTLFGVEGSFASLYWICIREVVDVEFEKRVTKGAKDVFNSSLNYAYAILYNTIQNVLLKTGLNIYISFLHFHQDNKPTLVYDLIEEFRAFVVDRVIVSMFNKNEPINLIDGMLDIESRKLIAKNIIEKLNSFTYYKKEKVKIENIIYMQAYNLRSFILENKKYKAFIGKY